MKSFGYLDSNFEIYLGFGICKLKCNDAESMNQRFDTDTETLKRQVIIETYRSSGPGGQRKNKVETAVRLKHLASGVTVVATEHRSQAENRRLAFERLRKRLIKLNRPQRRRLPTSTPRTAIEKRMEEKRIRSKKKRLRQKESEDWD
jgi:protein subunit release factor B